MKAQVVALLVITAAACAAKAPEGSIAYRKQVILSVPVHIVQVDLSDRNVKVTVAMAKSGRGSSETASSIVSRTRPAAAITGTFFDVRSCLPTGDIVIAGVRAHSGCLGSALCITPTNHAEILTHRERAHRPVDVFDTILAGGMTLVKEGHVSIEPRKEGFSDPALFRSNRRTAVGLTSTEKLLLVAVNSRISLHTLAKIMIRAGAANAMLLDGGSSATMYADGRFVSNAARRLTNLLEVYQTAETYHGAEWRLAPTPVTQQISAVR